MEPYRGRCPAARGPVADLRLRIVEPPPRLIVEAGAPRTEEAGIRDHLHADLPTMLQRSGKSDTESVVVVRDTVRAYGFKMAT
jgi:hypothetical protein